MLAKISCSKIEHNVIFDEICYQIFTKKFYLIDKNVSSIVICWTFEVFCWGPRHFYFEESPNALLSHALLTIHD